MSYDDLRDNLIIYETTFFNQLHDENRNKKGLALKATSSPYEEERDDEGGPISKDEEIAFLTRRLYRLNKEKYRPKKRQKFKKKKKVMIANST